VVPEGGDATVAPAELTDGLWRWTARHPEWHPGDFGAEVAAFLVQAGDRRLLIDPIAAPDPLPGRGEVAILITIPYHVRDSEELAERHDATIYGHRAVHKRLGSGRRYEEIGPGDELPGGATVHAIGKPRRYEMPIHLPSHSALVFGDAVVEWRGALRVWTHDPVDDDVARFYRERFNPTLRPLLDLDVDRVLVTHGEPVLEDGRAELQKALRRKPWYHRG
jgi:hypothetical protein